MTINEQFRECFKDVPVGTKLTRKQIIGMLHERFGTNETSIIPSDHCYNMTNKGIRGSDRQNNFFLNVGEGEYEYVGEHFTGMAISDVIQLYKQDFKRVDSEERYKWEAIGWYTLIEPTKRIGQREGMTVKLPYSQHQFGVPDNVYLIGTMNTADRSIATIDTALRRRFQFVEMQPDPDVLDGISVEDVSIKDLLIRMNRKITVLYDREHTIGHAYFMPLKASPTIETLAMIFSRNILPLLQEYFYEDYEKIRLVLGDNNKVEKDEQFILVNEEDYSELFGGTDYDFEDSRTYTVNPVAFGNIEAYRSI